MQKLVIFWCRRDFRMLDNPALFSAVKFARQNECLFLPVFLLDKEILDNNIGPIRKEFLGKLLHSFDSQFQDFGVKYAKAVDFFGELKTKFDLEIFANADIEPFAIARDKEIKKILGAKFHLYQDQVSVPSDTVSGTGNVYSVFSPFKRAVWDQFLQAPTCEVPDLKGLKFANSAELGFEKDWKIQNFESKFLIKAGKIEAKRVPFGVTKKIINDELFYELDMLKIRENEFDISTWDFEEKIVLSQFDYFVKHKLENYKKDRDYLGIEDATSQMSVALKWGIVSARTLKNKVIETKNYPNIGAEHYISELIWREFYKYILLHHPKVLDTEFQAKFR